MGSFNRDTMAKAARAEGPRSRLLLLLTAVLINKMIFNSVFRIRSRSRIRIHRTHMFLSLQDPDPLVKGMDPVPDPDPSVIMQKIVRKTFIPYIF
jgi:hypothetical protein